LIKLLIKLAIAALLANATWHVMSAYLSHYKFRDAVQQTTLFGNDKTVAELEKRILDLAAEYDVPLSADDVTVKRDLRHTITDGSYTRPIDLLPGYSRPWSFTFHVDTFSEAPLR